MNGPLRAVRISQAVTKKSNSQIQTVAAPKIFPCMTRKTQKRYPRNAENKIQQKYSCNLANTNQKVEGTHTK